MSDDHSFIEQSYVVELLMAMVRKIILSSVLVLILISSSSISLFPINPRIASAQQSSCYVTASVDKGSYNWGNTITLTFHTPWNADATKIVITAVDPANHVPFIGTYNVKTGQSYTLKITTASSDWYNRGTYHIHLQQGSCLGNSNSFTFNTNNNNNNQNTNNNQDYTCPAGDVKVGNTMCCPSNLPVSYNGKCYLPGSTPASINQNGGCPWGDRSVTVGTFTTCIPIQQSTQTANNNNQGGSQTCGYSHMSFSIPPYVYQAYVALDTGQWERFSGNFIFQVSPGYHNWVMTEYFDSGGTYTVHGSGYAPDCHAYSYRAG